ncbi:MAG: excinuclease ABC subunit UvrA, partial [Blautia sp.]
MSANAGNISVFFILPLITRLMGTISDMYAALRLLYARIGTPHVGTASYFSFNDPNGMCKTCSGIGKILDLDIERAIDPEKSWNEGMLELPAFGVGNYYWKLYTGSGLFDLNKKYRDYTPEERNLLLFGSREPGGPRAHKRVEGIKTQFQRLCLMKGPEEQNDYTLRKFNQFMEEKTCPVCHGRRLNEKSLSCKVAGYSIDEMCAMEFTELVKVLQTITDLRAATIVDALTASLTRMIDIGLPYLSMDRESSTLSGGEAQRLKLVRYMGSSLTGMTYIFDEPSTGMHPRDVYRMTKL